MEETKVKITREVEATSDGQMNYRGVPSTSKSPVNHTLLLKTAGFLATGIRIGTEVMKRLKTENCTQD